MDARQFEGRVEELERMAKERPGLYRVRVGAFAALGYVVYAAILLSALGLLGGTVALVIAKPSIWILKIGWKVAIPLGLFVVALARALYVSIDPPTGIALTPDTAPKLFSIIDDVSKRLRVPPLERVLAVEDFNASVIQIPRFGIFGSKSYLVLGIPLMQALSPKDLEAVIAHEFGHLSGNHSRFAGWVYRAVGSYVRVLEQTGGNKVLERFLGWYVPRLDAFSFPLRRRNEFEADAASAEIVGAARAGQALSNIHVRAGLEDGFWSDIKRRVKTTPHPPADVFAQWEGRVHGQSAASEADALKAALEEETGTADTHPSLRDRLSALGVEPAVEPSPEVNAARAFLGAHYDAIVHQVGLRWCAQVAEPWQEQHARIVAARERIEELEQVRETRTLTASEAFEYADLSEDVLDEDPLPRFEQVLEAHPDYVPAQFATGRLLLARDDARGVSLLKPLEGNSDVELRMLSSALLSSYFERVGDADAAARSLGRAQGAAQEREERHMAREELRVGDELIPHGLPDMAVSAIAEGLSQFPAVTRAYLVQKKLADGEPPLYVLAVDVSLKARVTKEEDLQRRIVDTLELPGETWIIRLDTNEKFRKPLRNVQGSEIAPAERANVVTAEA